jgi:hypothetical protein
MIKLKDYTRKGQKAKYYSSSAIGNFAYSSKEDLENWLEIEHHAGELGTSGKLSELKEYKLITWEIKGSETKKYKTIK